LIHSNLATEYAVNGWLSPAVLPWLLHQYVDFLKEAAWSCAE